MKAQQLPFDLGHRQAYEREDLWVSASNSDAVGWLDKWPDWPAPALIVYGPPASGKTHLARVWQKESGAVPVDPSDLTPPQEIILDDAEKFIGSERDEKNLFHLYNLLQERKGHMLLTAARPPREWNFVLPDLKSRLLAAPAVAVLPPDDQLRAVILTKLFSDRQIFVSQEVVEFVLPRIERSFAAMRDFVNDIDHRALAEKRPVTIPLVRELLQKDLFQSETSKI